MNSKRNTPRHIVFKMTKTRDKKRILKGKKKRTKPKTKYKGNPIRLSAHFSTETLQAGGINMIYLK